MVNPKAWLRSLLRKSLPDPIVFRLLKLEHDWQGRGPLLLSLSRLGSLWRTRPIRADFGWKYGQCIDRYFIEKFVECHANDIQGRVLEFAEDRYTHRFGGLRVTHSDILHAKPGKANVTIVADLANAPEIADNTFDCIIMTQVLQYVYDMRAGIQTLYRILRPGGVLLATFPGISQISRYDMENWGEYWRFTSLSARTLFAETFPKSSLTVETYGNVLASMAFLHGLLAKELRQHELEYRDRDYELLITLRAVKPPASS